MSPREATHPLVVGIDARAAVEEPGGRGTVVREQLRALARSRSPHRFVLYARERWDRAALDERFVWRLVPGPDPVWHPRAAQHANGRCDVFLATNSYLTPWFLRIPTVLMVHDLVTFDAELAPRSRSRWIERATLPLALRRAAGVVCISVATSRDLISRFPGARGRTVVAPLAASEAFARATDADVARVRRRHGLDGPYVLAVGTLEPRKNLPRLIRAFADVDQRVRAGTVLALAGARGWEREDLDAVLARHGAHVRVLGYVDDEDLAGLYRGAELFAFPSLYEGFGLPVLEAMQAGTAVVTSPVSSLPEVAGDCALFADPLDVTSIRDALATGLADPARGARMAAAGRERAARFTWERHLAVVLEALERAARGPR